MVKIRTIKKNARGSKSTEDDFYNIDNISEMVDDDQLSPEESGFMSGYLDADQ